MIKNAFSPHWNFIVNAWKQQRMPRALLLVGPGEVDILAFVAAMANMIFCRNFQEQPCNGCPECFMLREQQHPDLLWVRAHKKGLSIKIEQIRELQQDVFLGPQRGAHRVIILETVDLMNGAATNALLKILEEPPAHTVFILLAQQISTILPTITSRCQILNFAADKLYPLNFSELEHQVPANSQRADLLKRRADIFSALINLMEGKVHPCVLAAQWHEFELSDLMWFLYIVFAQMQFHIVAPQLIQLPEEVFFSQFIAYLDTKKLISQIDKIQEINRKLYRNVPLNATLVLENLLIELQSASC